MFSPCYSKLTLSVYSLCYSKLVLNMFKSSNEVAPP